MSRTVVRRLEVRAETVGAEKAISSVQSVGAAAQKSANGVREFTRSLEDVSGSAVETSKRTVSMASSVDRLQRSLDPVYSETQKWIKAQRELKLAMNQGSISLERHDELLGLAATKYRQVDVANDNFRQGLRQSDSALDQYRRSLDQTGDRLDTLQGRFSTAAAMFSKARFLAAGALGAAGLGGGMAIGGVVETASEFQRLEASLKTVTGSAAGAERALAFIKQFSTETPYTLQEVTESFIRLQALGLDPSRQALEAYGNTASAMGKPMMQFIEAVADATTGEMERLKEFGIRAAKDGDEIAFTFQGTTTVVKNSAEEIEGYLRDIGQTKFAGAMAEQMEILPGVFGNAQDAIANFQNAIGESGLSGAVQRTTEDFTSFLNANSELASSIGGFLGGAIDTYSTAIRGIGTAYSEAYQWTQATVQVVGGLVGSFSGAGAQIAGVGQGFVSTAEAIASGWHASGRIIYETLNRLIGAGVGAYQSIVATWEQLPTAFTKLAKEAGNALIDGLQSGIGGAVEGINTVLDAVGLAKIGAPDLSQFKAEFTDAEVTVGETIASIMSAAQATDYLSAGFAAGTAPIQRAVDAIAAAKQRIAEAAAASATLGEQTILTGEGFKIATPAIDDASASLGKFGDAAGRATEAAQRQIDQLELEISLIGKSEGASATCDAETADLETALKEARQ